MISDCDALILVDVQEDFLPGGALPVERGDEIIPVLNRWIGRARRQGIPIIASRDWHPPNHVSFEDRGGPWPRHCVRDTPGAAFASALNLPEESRIVSKGTDPDSDQYSPFEGTDLADTLKAKGVSRLWIGGLAEDVCVRQTVLDARKAGFEVYLLAAATRPVNRDSGRKALQEMCEAGAVIEQDEGHD